MCEALKCFQQFLTTLPVQLKPFSAMEVIAFPYTTLFRGTATDYSRHCVDLISTNKNPSLIGLRRLSSRVRAITEFPPAVEPTQVSLTWQIVVGAVAGVAPFVVAGIEFSKRIMAQRKCQVCAGSGLVLREKYYIRCPACGGFLPWQSWKRFFSG